MKKFILIAFLSAVNLAFIACAASAKAQITPENISSFEQKCESGDAKACYDLGAFYSGASSVTIDAKKAVSYYKKACELNDALSCADLGASIAMLQDEKDALSHLNLEGETMEKYLLKSCDLGYGAACEFMSDLIKQEAKNEADKALKEGILKGNAANFDDISKKLKQVKALDEKAFQIYTKGCEKKDGESCYNLAKWYAKNGDEKAKEYLSKSCDLKFAQACVDEAARYQNEQNYAKMINYYELACRYGMGAACGLMGDLYDTENKFAQKDAEKAEKFYKKACDLDEIQGFGCVSLGNFYYKNSKFDAAKAVWEGACEKNYINSCIVLAQLYYTGEAPCCKDLQVNQVLQDFKKAHFHYKKLCEISRSARLDNKSWCDTADSIAYLLGPKSDLSQSCEKGSAQSCYEMARNYQLTKDYARALEHYEKACDKGHGGACDSVGIFYKLGRGGEKDNKKAFEAYQKGCELKNTYSCKSLADEYLQGAVVKKDYIKAAHYYRVSCDGGYSAACRAFGNLNPRSAIMFLEKSCEQNSMSSCIELGEYYESQNDEKKAIAAYEKACEYHYGCDKIAEIYTKKDTIKGKKTALKYHEKACKGNNAKSCKIAAFGYLEPPYPNPSEAKKHFERACKLGDKESCEESKKWKGI